MALSADTELKSQGAGRLREYDVIASDIIYRGALVAIQRTTSGYAQPATKTATNRPIFAGIATKQVDNSSGAAGDKQVECYTEGAFLLPFTNVTLTQADVGALAYAEDDGIATDAADDGSSNLYPIIGRIIRFVSANLAWVELRSPGSD